MGQSAAAKKRAEQRARKAAGTAAPASVASGVKAGQDTPKLDTQGRGTGLDKRIDRAAHAAGKAAVVKAGRPVKVEALQTGFYGLKRRRVGDVFVVTDPSDFSAKWMKPVDGSTPESITTGNQELARMHDETLAQKVRDNASGQRGATGPAEVDSLDV
jgi:hypothetical protein